eukprot:EG_transcript_62455
MSCLGAYEPVQACTEGQGRAGQRWTEGRGWLGWAWGAPHSLGCHLDGLEAAWDIHPPINGFLQGRVVTNLSQSSLRGKKWGVHFIFFVTGGREYPCQVVFPAVC